jgi:hypothetical protein
MELALAYPEAWFAELFWPEQPDFGDEFELLFWVLCPAVS